MGYGQRFHLIDIDYIIKVLIMFWAIQIMIMNTAIVGLIKTYKKILSHAKLSTECVSYE